MIKGVIFDLDGVLVSTDRLHFLAWQRLAKELGITSFTEEDNIRQRGVSRMESLEVVLEKSDRNYSAAEKELLAEQKNEFYKEMLENIGEEAVLEGARETLLTLRERGIAIGVGSVSKNAPVILERTGLLPLIDQVSCGLDITRSKPDPEVFLVAANKLQLPYESCLVVEDSAAGIEAAKAAKMGTLAVGPDYMDLDAQYHSRTLFSDVDWDVLLG